MCLKGREFFGNSLYDDLKSNTEVENVWADLKKESIKGIANDEANFSPMAYIFKCLNCGEYITIWDCD